MFRPHSTSEPSADIYFQVFAGPTATRESPIRCLNQRWAAIEDKRQRLLP